MLANAFINMWHCTVCPLNRKLTLLTAIHLPALAVNARCVSLWDESHMCRSQTSFSASANARALWTPLCEMLGGVSAQDVS